MGFVYVAAARLVFAAYGAGDRGALLFSVYGLRVPSRTLFVLGWLVVHS